MPTTLLAACAARRWAWSRGGRGQDASVHFVEKLPLTLSSAAVSSAIANNEVGTVATITAGLPIRAGLL